MSDEGVGAGRGDVQGSQTYLTWLSESLNASWSWLTEYLRESWWGSWLVSGNITWAFNLFCGVFFSLYTCINSACSAFFSSQRYNFPVSFIIGVVISRFLSKAFISGISTYRYFTDPKIGKIDEANILKIENQFIIYHYMHKDARHFGLEGIDYLHYMIFHMQLQDMKLIRQCVAQNKFFSEEDIQKLRQYREAELDKFLSEHPEVIAASDSKVAITSEFNYGLDVMTNMRRVIDSVEKAASEQDSKGDDASEKLAQRLYKARPRLYAKSQIYYLHFIYYPASDPRALIVNKDVFNILLKKLSKDPELGARLQSADLTEEKVTAILGKVNNEVKKAAKTGTTPNYTVISENDCRVLQRVALQYPLAPSELIFNTAVFEKTPFAELDETVVKHIRDLAEAGRRHPDIHYALDINRFLTDYFYRRANNHYQAPVPSTETLSPLEIEVRRRQNWLLEAIHDVLTHQQYDSIFQLSPPRQESLREEDKPFEIKIRARDIQTVNLFVLNTPLKNLIKQEIAEIARLYPDTPQESIEQQLLLGVYREIRKEHNRTNTAKNFRSSFQGDDSYNVYRFAEEGRVRRGKENDIKLFQGKWEKVFGALGRLLGTGSAFFFMAQTIFAAKSTLISLFHITNPTLTFVFILASALATFFGSDTFATPKIQKWSRKFARILIDQKGRYLWQYLTKAEAFRIAYSLFIGGLMVFSTNSLLLYSLYKLTIFGATLPHALCMGICVFTFTGSMLLISSIIYKSISAFELSHYHYGKGHSRAGVLVGYVTGFVCGTLSTMISVFGAHTGLIGIGYSLSTSYILAYGGCLLGSLHFYMPPAFRQLTEKCDPWIVRLLHTRPCVWLFTAKRVQYWTSCKVTTEQTPTSQPEAEATTEEEAALLSTTPRVRRGSGIQLDKAVRVAIESSSREDECGDHSPSDRRGHRISRSGTPSPSESPTASSMMKKERMPRAISSPDLSIYTAPKRTGRHFPRASTSFVDHGDRVLFDTYQVLSAVLPEGNPGLPTEPTPSSSSGTAKTFMFHAGYFGDGVSPMIKGAQAVSADALPPLSLTAPAHELDTQGRVHDLICQHARASHPTSPYNTQLMVAQ